MAKLKPNPMGDDGDTETFEQKESVGDVLISVTDQRCTVEEVGQMELSADNVWTFAGYLGASGGRPAKGCHRGNNLLSYSRLLQVLN